MVFASIREHAEHCDFLRARAEIKNLLCELASNCKNLGSTSERSLVSILRANRAKVKFCEQLKIFQWTIHHPFLLFTDFSVFVKTKLSAKLSYIKYPLHFFARLVRIKNVKVTDAELVTKRTFFSIFKKSDHLCKCQYVNSVVF